MATPDTMDVDLFTSPPRDNMFEFDQFSTPPPRQSGGNSEKKHRALYKTPPNWLNSYRNKCLDALSARRQERSARLVDSFRKINLDITDADQEYDSKDEIIRQVMTSVYKECNFTLDYDTFCKDYELYLKDLEMELLQEDPSEYYNRLKNDLEQNEFEWTIENQYSIACFACQKNAFSLYSGEDKTQVICHQCNFQFSLDFPVTEEQFHNRVYRLIDKHSSNCCQMFQFELINYPLSDVKFKCKACNFDKMLFS